MSFDYTLCIYTSTVFIHPSLPMVFICFHQQHAQFLLELFAGGLSSLQTIEGPRNFSARNAPNARTCAFPWPARFVCSTSTASPMVRDTQVAKNGSKKELQSLLLILHTDTKPGVALFWSFFVAPSSWFRRQVLPQPSNHKPSNSWRMDPLRHTLTATIKFAKLLEDSGCALLTIHGRLDHFWSWQSDQWVLLKL